ncbi:hypothetical protein POM88_023957 [Heracleum sosnowskyi]|uniref:Uncharacterized protein n=1 Tax=Heracleum sosnowskyi TaxID=360622 RepID=A0AAD8MVF8_9APIA|nr:hypothetical protein POM88_023957 [Heracleum sosnowskyi]
MWASRVSPGFVPLPRPLHTKPNRIFFVSAKFQPHRSRRENINYNYNHDDDDDVEVSPISTETEESFSISHFKSEGTGEQQQQVPSGSDILRALQRASVRKLNNKKKKQKLRLVSDSKVELETGSNRRIGDVDAPVKPLRSRSDWSARLDELELRLRDLLHV